jgi:hypothetical protein
LEHAVKWAQEHIYTLSQERASQQWQQEELNPAPDTTVTSMPRSSMGSAPANDAVHPVDDIEDRTTRELHIKVKNVSIKVADGYALPNPPDARFHCGSIAAGYARVGVDDVLSAYYNLELDIPGGDD